MIKFILKGLIRDRLRSRSPVLIVAAGVFLTVFLYSWMQGVIDNLVSSNAQFDTGHLKITTRAYQKIADQMPNDLALLDVSNLLGKLEADETNIIWTPRIRFGGLLDIPDTQGETKAQGPVMGFGVDLLSPDSPEIKILNIKNAIIKGAAPHKQNEILISDHLAEKLGIKIGDTATFLGSTMNGSMAAYNFKVAGTVQFGITAMDRGTIIADIRDLQSALDMEDGASEIVGFSKSMMYSDKEMKTLAEKFNKKYSDEKDKFSPSMLTLSQQNDLAEYLRFAETMGSIIVIIFVFAMSIVLWNSGLMNGLRRYGEFGLRLALGEPKGTLYRWMIFESSITGFIGSVIGTSFGLVFSFYLQYKGFNLESVLQKSTMMISNELRAQVTIWSYIIGFFPGLIASITGIMFAGIGIYRRQTSQLFKELEA